MARVGIRFRDSVLTIDFEKPDPDAENSAQRIRRKKFYLQNGFLETGCYQNMQGIDFEIVTSKLPLDFHWRFRICICVSLQNKPQILRFFPLVM